MGLSKNRFWWLALLVVALSHVALGDYFMQINELTSLTTLGKEVFAERVFPDVVKAANPAFGPIRNYQGSVKIQAFSLGLEQTVNLGSQTSGAAAGKVHFQSLTIERVVDQYSPQFFLWAASGKALQVTLVVTSGVGRGAVQLSAVYKFGLAYVSSQVQKGDEGAPREVLTFEYGQLTMMKGTFGNDGSVLKVSNAGWDMTKNKVMS